MLIPIGTIYLIEQTGKLKIILAHMALGGFDIVHIQNINALMNPRFVFNV